MIRYCFYKAGYTRPIQVTVASSAPPQLATCLCFARLSFSARSWNIKVLFSLFIFFFPSRIPPWFKLFFFFTTSYPSFENAWNVEITLHSTALHIISHISHNAKRKAQLSICSYTKSINQILKFLSDFLIKYCTQTTLDINYGNQMELYVQTCFIYFLMYF